MPRSFFATHRNFCRETFDLLRLFLPNGLKDKSKKSKLIHFDHLNHGEKRAGVID